MYGCTTRLIVAVSPTPIQRRERALTPAGLAGSTRRRAAVRVGRWVRASAAQPGLEPRGVRRSAVRGTLVLRLRLLEEQPRSMADLMMGLHSMAAVHTAVAQGISSWVARIAVARVEARTAAEERISRRGAHTAAEAPMAVAQGILRWGEVRMAAVADLMAAVADRMAAVVIVAEIASRGGALG